MKWPLVVCPVCKQVNCWYLKFLAFMLTTGSASLIAAVILR